MDAVKFLKEELRMCKNYNECCDCPVSHYNNGSKEGCKVFFKSNPEKYVEIVEKWSSEHPIKTRQSEFLKMFPNVRLNECGSIGICPRDVDIDFDKCEGGECAKCEKEYWLVEVD